ncbi:MAG: hypothetical protein RL430_1507 [Actinomycetota bacterium]
MSANGSDATATPAPSPLSTARSPVAYARESRGISSMTSTARRMSRVRPRGRPRVCVATSTAKLGESAPSAQTNGAAQDSATIIGRRPLASARATIGREITMPQRTIADPSPCAEFDTPNSSAANATVCVNRVFVKATSIEPNPTSNNTFR